MKLPLFLVSFLSFLSAIYFAYRMYFTPSEANNALLWSLIEEGNTSFFLCPKTKNGQFIDEVIEGKMKVAFNLMQSVLAIVELTSLGSAIYLLVLFYRNLPSDNLAPYLLNLAIFAFNGILFFLALTAYLRLLQNGQFRWFHYRVYQKALLSVLVPFVEYNHLYGQLFAVFLVCNCPINALFVVTLLHPGDVSFFGQMYMASYSCLQLVALFIIHLYLVSFSKHIHAPSYLLMRIHGRSLRSRKAFCRVGAFRVRLQIAASIGAFNTKQKYGLTYGPFGQVTLRSFITFLLLYGKLLMTVYRRIYL